LLEKIVSRNPDHPFLGDRELALLAIQNDASELRYASRSLREDRNFIFSVVKQVDGVLLYVEAELRRGEDIVTEAIAKSSREIVDSFDSLGSVADFELLAELARSVRTRLELYDTYVCCFLRGISICNRSQYCRCKSMQLATTQPRLRDRNCFQETDH
jgi:hypothetical protein